MFRQKQSTNAVVNVVSLKSKYKEESKKAHGSSVYSQLPETMETQFARTVSDLQSQVRTSSRPQR